MAKITEYAIVDAVSRNELERKVNVEIRAGWQPYGNLVATHTGNSWIHTQTMVKYEKEAE